MMPGKLYIKIFISFLVVLVITEGMVFGLFLFTAGRIFRSRIEYYLNAKVLVAKEFVEDKIREAPGIGPAENESLKKLILFLGETYGAKVWLSAPDGTPLQKSYQTDIAHDLARFYEKGEEDLGHFKLYRGSRRHWRFYTITPITNQGGEVGNLHILFEEIGPPHPEGGFALGLVAIGIVIALLIIPVSRLITNPLKRVQNSALRIAEGDLSHRAVVKSKDEIGELGRAFNLMADHLERLIRGGRELTANISHELRSPLARIRVSEELLRERLERGDHKDLKRHLDDIQEDVLELDRLIGRILDLSKLDVQETGLTLEPLDPVSLINELLERLRPVIKHKGLHLKKELSFDSRFLGDRDALRTAFSNILENAVKFTSEDGHVNVIMASEYDTLVIRVTNSFEALSPDDLTGIFEPFYRTRGDRGDGSGLGLAITKKLIERHGGSTEALNSAEGLTIQVSLPLKADRK